MRVTGMPRSGEIRIDGRLRGHLRADKLAAATLQAGGRRLGDHRDIDILVEDGHGGSVLGSLAISVTASNRPPAVEAARRRISPVPSALRRRPIPTATNCR